MESYNFLLVLAIIMLSTKVLGLLSARVHMPQVVGALAAGIILGPSVLGVVGETDFLLKSAEIGVILLMFSAGLDTDLDELKQTGLAAFVVACIGVLVPLAGGAFCYLAFFPSTDPNVFMRALFVGVVMTATSVSITVETLREMGRLRGKVGSTILGAAIIDDILGILLLTAVTGFTDPTARPMLVLGKLGLYIVFILIVAFFMHFLFQRMEAQWNKRRRIAIAGVAFAFILSYISEAVFGVADITGAYFAGLMLCNIWGAREYINRKVTILSYMVFSPLFFASIGIKTELAGMNTTLLLFSLVLLILAILSKMVGCGLGAKFMGFNAHESLAIGCGMVSRGEVALIVAQRGAQIGLIDTHLFPALVLMVVITTLITPILLKFSMKNMSTNDPEIDSPLARIPKQS